MASFPGTSACFVVQLRDLDDGPRTLESEIPLEWLSAALAGTEANATDRPGRLRLVVSKNGQEVLVRGKVEVEVVVPCARTLAPINLVLSPDVLLLLRRADGPGTRLHGTAKRHRPTGRGEREREAERGRHSARGGWPETPELSQIDAAQDSFEGEQIVLDSFLREFILLELPMFPVRQDLPSLPVEARASALASGSKADSSGTDAPPRLDPRLAPLAELKDRLQKKDKE